MTCLLVRYLPPSFSPPFYLLYIPYIPLSLLSLPSYLPSPFLRPLPPALFTRPLLFHFCIHHVLNFLPFLSFFLPHPHLSLILHCILLIPLSISPSLKPSTFCLVHAFFPPPCFDLFVHSFSTSPLSTTLFILPFTSPFPFSSTCYPLFLFFLFPFSPLSAFHYFTFIFIFIICFTFICFSLFHLFIFYSTHSTFHLLSHSSLFITTFSSFIPLIPSLNVPFSFFLIYFPHDISLFSRIICFLLLPLCIFDGSTPFHFSAISPFSHYVSSRFPLHLHLLLMNHCPTRLVWLL